MIWKTDIIHMNVSLENEFSKVNIKINFISTYPSKFLKMQFTKALNKPSNT